MFQIIQHTQAMAKAHKEVTARREALRLKWGISVEAAEETRNENESPADVHVHGFIIATIPNANGLKQIALRSVVTEALRWPMERANEIAASASNDKKRCFDSKNVRFMQAQFNGNSPWLALELEELTVHLGEHKGAKGHW